MRTFSNSFVSTREASYLAGVSEEDVNRVIDEQLIPAALLPGGPERRVTRLAAVFISFYFHTDALLSGRERRRVIATLANQVVAADQLDQLSLLTVEEAPPTEQMLRAIECRQITAHELHLLSFFRDIRIRAAAVAEAVQQITTDPEIMGDEPVFKGTRVPIDTVLASLEAGIDFTEVKDSYAFLTPELVRIARVYASVRPRRLPLRRLFELNPDWEVVSVEIVHRGSL